MSHFVATNTKEIYAARQVMWNTHRRVHQKSWDRQLAMPDTWPVNHTRVNSLDESPGVLVYTSKIHFRLGLHKKCPLKLILKRKPASSFCLKWNILPEKSVVLWNLRKHLQYASCFCVLEYSGYWIEYLSQFIGVVLWIKNGIRTVSTLPSHSSADDLNDHKRPSWS